MHNTFNQYMEKVSIIAVEAGKLTLSYFNQGPELLAQKSDMSPLTAADLAANEYILAQLQAMDATIPIISEEEPLPDYEVRKMWPRFWLIDPLDGTKEFLKGSDEFTVNIALIENQEPVVGVIYIPAKSLLYYAAKGEGAWKQERREEIKVWPRPTRIFSSLPDVNRPLVVVESKSHPSMELENFLNNLSGGVKKRINAGSSLKFCLVAEGAADIYPRMNPTMEWDVAAGDCIFRNSARHGQRFSPLIYNKASLRNESFVIGL